MFLADFHVHTNWSDGKMPMAEVVDLYGKRGFGAIAITDHLCESRSVLGRASRFLGCSLTEESFPKYIAALRVQAERAWREYRMLVIPGFEITLNSISNHRSAHVLAVGIDQYVDPNLGIVDLCREIRQNGGLAIAAHPVSTRKLEKQTYHLWSRREELKPHFDAWEVASGPHLFEEVLHSGLPMIANSDLHHPRQINAWKTELRCEKSLPAILQAVRGQDINFVFYSETSALPRNRYELRSRALPTPMRAAY